MLSREEYEKIHKLCQESPQAAEIQKMLQKENQLQLSMVSHEVRNPVTLINSFLQLMASSHPEVKDFPYWQDIMENMQFFGALYGMKTKDISSRAFSTASLVGLENDFSRPVQSFSGGMKRRLSLAIALLHQPQVLILDEPTVGIDPLLRQKIWQQLRAIADSGVSIVLTTHVMDEAEKCDYLAMLRDGQIIAEDTPSALKRNTNSATIEEAFIYYGEVDHAH